MRGHELEPHAAHESWRRKSNTTIQNKTLHQLDLIHVQDRDCVGSPSFKKLINEFVLKELAALELNKNKAPHTILSEPPFDWNILPAEYKVTNSSLQRNYHGIPWDSENIPYIATGPIVRGILQRAPTICVKGLENKSGY